MLYGGQLQDVLRLSTALVGLLAGALFLHTGERQLVAHASRRETRVLVAVVVAATALGPILVAITGEVEGPLSALADLYVGPERLLRHQPDRDLADILMSVMPALLVLVLAAGLRRGRRFAWWAAMVVPRAAARARHLLRHRLLQLGRRERRTGPGFQLGRLAAAAGAAAGVDHRPAGAHPPVVHRAGAGRHLPQARADACSAWCWRCGRSTSSSARSSPTSSPRRRVSAS